MDERTQARIARINEISALARTAWFTLLAYLVFVGITLMSIEDADFFLASRSTQLPLVNIQIPTRSFFWVSPIIGTALYIYVHLFLIKLWDAHALAETTEAHATHQWLVNDFILLHRKDRAALKRPLVPYYRLLTLVLVYASAPVVLCYAWLKSMPAHNEWMTLLIAGCLAATLHVGLTSWSHLIRRVASPDDRSSTLADLAGRSRVAILAGTLIPIALVLAQPDWLHISIALRVSAALMLLFAIFIIGLKRAGIPSKWKYGRALRRVALVRRLFRHDQCELTQHWWRAHYSLLIASFLVLTSLLATMQYVPPLLVVGADLSENKLVSLPPDWRSRETARRTFRETWCNREGLEMSICGQANGSDATPVWIEHARVRWCADLELEGSECADALTGLEADFASAWQKERQSTIAALQAPNLTSQDLRRANLSLAVLVGTDLSLARMEGANLGRARMEGADLSGARMEGADLTLALMDGADLTWAQMDGADLTNAQMNGANLTGAQMEGVRLDEAQMEGAELRSAQMDGADLSEAQLEGANLSLAQMEGANLTRANFKSASWAGAHLRSPAQAADFRGGRNLEQAQLDQLIGNARTLLPISDPPRTIPSCWPELPASVEAMIPRKLDVRYGLETEEDVRTAFLCPEGEAPQPTGTPCALDLTPEDCLDPRVNPHHPAAIGRRSGVAARP